ncbi:hypothetical protein HXX76_013682 [Chlamydomonas incerta]|uniref:Uncharacterized protein n=1 Tax=Chlamydomonas incerta TaxID=51695 RepID=A0A835VQH7_CHLIN|nr:hypothetical protein HXX76_013682 [Chlamydomonas incerta]|eukprot:KAG2425472.1 hypothetical protein HXX76_013682 [Chlamydomonas incerta]
MSPAALASQRRPCEALLSPVRCAAVGGSGHQPQSRAAAAVSALAVDSGDSGGSKDGTSASSRGSSSSSSSSGSSGGWRQVLQDGVGGAGSSASSGAGAGSGSSRSSGGGSGGSDDGGSGAGGSSSTSGSSGGGGGGSGGSSLLQVLLLLLLVGQPLILALGLWFAACALGGRIETGLKDAASTHAFNPASTLAPATFMPSSKSAKHKAAISAYSAGMKANAKRRRLS